MATLEFNNDRWIDDTIVAFAHGADMFGSITLSREEAWTAYRNLQSVLVGPYNGRNGKYNGN